MESYALLRYTLLCQLRLCHVLRYYAPTCTSSSPKAGLNKPNTTHGSWRDALEKCNGNHLRHCTNWYKDITTSTDSHTIAFQLLECISTQSLVTNAVIMPALVGLAVALTVEVEAATLLVEELRVVPVVEGLRVVPALVLAERLPLGPPQVQNLNPINPMPNGGAPPKKKLDRWQNSNPLPWAQRQREFRIWGTTLFPCYNFECLGKPRVPNMTDLPPTYPSLIHHCTHTTSPSTLDPITPQVLNPRS